MIDSPILEVFCATLPLVAPGRTPIRCAIYTRQSVELQNDLSFCQVRVVVVSGIVRNDSPSEPLYSNSQGSGKKGRCTPSTPQATDLEKLTEEAIGGQRILGDNSGRCDPPDLVSQS